MKEFKEGNGELNMYLEQAKSKYVDENNFRYMFRNNLRRNFNTFVNTGEILSKEASIEFEKDINDIILDFSEIKKFDREMKK